MPEQASTTFPFTAIVGNEALKQALLLNLVDPRIGGVLVRGDRGTAKTTVVRALASLLPPIATRAGCPVMCDPALGACGVCGNTGAVVEQRARLVELPLGATEDRVVGTIDLARVLASGERRFEAGLLGAAHRGLLYIDEVNLLPDHLVDLLLDVAASGVNVVERDGATATHPARFILVGTMNPEEGDLRPQLLDRFGLIVDVHTPVDATMRAEVVRRRIAFDSDPATFLARFAASEDALRDAVRAARDRLGTIEVPNAILDHIVALCVEANADGLRADITLYRTASAIAAMAGRVEVTEQDVLDAAPLVLTHRQHQPRPGQQPRQQQSPPTDRTDEDDRPDDGGAGLGATPPPRGPSGTDGADAPGDGGEARDGTTMSSDPGRVDVPLPDGAARRPGGRMHGATEGTRGRIAGVRAWDGRSRDLAVVPTVIARATRGHLDGAGVDRRDVRVHRRRGPAERLVLLVVDASGSMGAAERMRRTKAGIRSVIDRVYLRRDRIAVQAFRGGRSTLLVPPGKNIAAARASIEALPTGGGTPLRDALVEAAMLLRRRARTHPDETSLVVVVTDARTRVAVRDAAEELASVATDCLVVDTEAGASRLGRARQLAGWLGASYELLSGDDEDAPPARYRPAGYTSEATSPRPGTAG